ncbi:MAG: hypothetical protein VKN13_07485 [Cyanobacteriota bacterium]|nr:hypothetical protein [Cyanobacteriota bacterium]
MVSQPQPSDRQPPSGSRWRVWLVLGLIFGLGYGLSQRLLGLRVDGLLPDGKPSYGFKAPPGTRLEELRKRSSGTAPPIRADLEKLERETRQKREAAEASRRKAEAEARRQQEQERRDTEALNPPAPLPPAAVDLPPAAVEPPPPRESTPPPVDVIAPPGAVGADPPPPPIQP